MNDMVIVQAGELVGAVSRLCLCRALAPTGLFASTGLIQTALLVHLTRNTKGGLRFESLSDDHRDRGSRNRDNGVR